MTLDRNDVPRLSRIEDRIEEALSFRPPAPDRAGVAGRSSALDGTDPVQISDPAGRDRDTTALVVTVAVQLLWDIVHRAYYAESPDADLPPARSSAGSPAGRSRHRGRDDAHARSVRRGRTA
ncbi:hypothetical protein [Pseudonocardia xinjiangensis]|uniref:Uncharacterized protein n=1 Tax=Pseudonocardia xinjiangensis TaxID=75289 RepID=A0ABX1RNJ8_9PSEU|nr:hypothetical protein [Pseudonocardia xinjiangensis]NMH81972.1 hypothetical protein [Pseudonocardia xinjiangensis]